MAIYKPGFLLKIFNAFTDKANNEEGFIKWVTNVFTIGTAKTGSGTARDLEFDVSGTKLHVKADGTIYLDAAGQTVGNARGIGAVDLQNMRELPTMVASGALAVAIGQRNFASGAYSVTIGYLNTASNTSAKVFGYGCTSSGLGAISIGYVNTASADVSTNLGGQQCTASGKYSTTMGVYSSAANNSQISFGYAPALGNAQGNLQTLYSATTDATPTILNITGTVTDRVVIPAKRGCTVLGYITAYSDSTDGYKVASWEIKCVIERNASNTTRIVGTPIITQLAADAEAVSGGWAVTSITADDTNEALAITVQGEAGTNIRWQGSLFYGQA